MTEQNLKQQETDHNVQVIDNKTNEIYKTYDNESLMRRIESYVAEGQRVDKNQAFTFVVGPIHGNKRLLLEVLNTLIDQPKAFNDNVVFSGGIIGAGGESAECLKIIKNFRKKYGNVVCLRGKEEARLLKARPSFFQSDIGKSFLKSVKKISGHKQAAWELFKLMEMIKDMPTFFVGTQVFVTPNFIDPDKDFMDQTNDDLLFKDYLNFKLTSGREYDKTLCYSGVNSDGKNESSKVSIKRKHIGLYTNPNVTNRVSIAVFDNKNKYDNSDDALENIILV